MHEVPKRTTTTIAVNDEDRARADRIIELGLADTFSEAVRKSLALALLAVDKIGGSAISLRAR